MSIPMGIEEVKRHLREFFDYIESFKTTDLVRDCRVERNFTAKFLTGINDYLRPLTFGPTYYGRVDPKIISELFGALIEVKSEPRFIPFIAYNNHLVDAILETIAGHPDTPKDILVKLIESSDKNISLAAKENPSIRLYLPFD